MKRWLMTLALMLAPLAAVAQPIRLHPHNPRVFEYRGNPLVLITATEHYGAVMNRPFQWEPYLDDLVDKRMTASRLFVLYRELQTAVNPYSTCKPETLDYISPYLRTGPGDARDRLPKYNLDQWNPEFFTRLHGFLSAAEKRGIIVEITLLADHHKPEIWELNPQHPLNNINQTPVIQPEEYITSRHPKLWERQRAFVEKIVRECNRYDNVFYEICNEPQGNFPQQGGGSVLIDERQRATANTRPNPTHEEIDEWQREVAKVVRKTEASLPNKHLISGQPAYLAAPPYAQFLSEGFSGDAFDIVNVHQMHRTSYADKYYDISMFMSRQLRLQNLRDLFVATAAEKKPLNMDEDNAASRFTNDEGWTIHRKRAWTTLLSGGHYDVIDFTIQNRLETGTLEAQEKIRSWVKHLSQLLHSMDLAHAKPMPQMVKQAPEHVIASVLGVERKEYAIYLADAREVMETGLGDTIQGEVLLTLPEGGWTTQFLNPTTGKLTEGPRLKGGELTIALPGFRHDIALRLTRQ
ncbi:MAG: cellulase family glycosylhydrolase [Kofleriaceae bacterium]